MHADQILFVENGEIVERGTHEALLAAGGRYKALYDLQVRPDDVLTA
jgi:ATP-binding cassette subfamily B protein